MGGMSGLAARGPGGNGRGLTLGVNAVLLVVFSLVVFSPSSSRARSQDNLPPLLKAQLDSLAEPLLDLRRAGEVRGPITLQRDAARFVFNSGTIVFFASVQGRVTGALFRGRGEFDLVPPTTLEREQLKRFTGDTVRHCAIEELYFRFTDMTFEELLPQLEPLNEPNFRAGDQPPGKYAKHLANELYYSMASRLLMDLHNGTDDGLFYAAIDPDDDTRYHFLIEPLFDEAVKLYRRPSTPDIHPIDLVCSWDRESDAAGDRTSNQIASVHYDLHTVINEPSRTAITTTLEFASRHKNLRAVRFDLAANLVIDSLSAEQGAVYFYYNNPQIPLNYNAAFPVAGSGGSWGTLDIFWADPLPESKISSISFSYHGKYILYQFPWGDFYINEATTWYPTHDWRSRTTYDMTFEFSARRDLIAAGNKLNEQIIGDRKHSHWRMDYPVSFVSFNYGHFERLEMPKKEGLPLVEIYRGKNHSGNVFNKDMKQKVGEDIVGALALFTEAYGPLPFDRLAATEIPGRHGQGFPQLLHLSWSSFQEQQAGMTELFRAHEVAHQWWGHLVGWTTYHDQWLSEGFAEYSGAWYVEHKYGRGNELKDIFNVWKKGILQRGGRRNWHDGPQVAPLWMGGRCSSYDSPGSYFVLVYYKGAYVMHMLRMIMHDFKSGSDRRFMDMMTDFVTLHRGASASTEDFRQVVEDHLGGPMDWFFDQWVYGTEIPRFKYTKNIVKQEDGTFVVSGRIEQSEVSEPFRVFMPITFDFGKDKKSTFVQEITDWVTTFESPPLPLKPRKVIFNDYWTVLCRD